MIPTVEVRLPALLEPLVKVLLGDYSLRIPLLYYGAAQSRRTADSLLVWPLTVSLTPTSRFSPS